MTDQLLSAALRDPELLDSIPALEPPPGVTPNFTNPERKVASGITICSILVGVMILFFAARVYTKHFIVRKYSWDDCKFFKHWKFRAVCNNFGDAVTCAFSVVSFKILGLNVVGLTACDPDRSDSIIWHVYMVSVYQVHFYFQLKN